MPLATFSSEPLTKSIIPSFPRATANLILHVAQEAKAKAEKGDGYFWFGNNRKREAVSKASPARADIDVVDFAGHHG